MLLLTTAALPQLERHRHPNLGRLITPRHYCRLDDTLAAGISVAVDNDCFLGPDAAALVVEARRRGYLAHMGRCSTARRIRYAQSIGCTRKPRILHQMQASS